MTRTAPHTGTPLFFGGDYNPEQWPREVWREDVALMREAGVNLVSLGVFAWAELEPRPGEFAWDWLDEVIGLLHEGGIGIALGTPTAAPPAWFYRAHPDALPVDRQGVRLAFGSRGAICHSHPAYRAAATAVVEQLAERYGSHPALRLWHVHNEYDGPSLVCYCELCAAAFRTWLRERHGTLDALNSAWGTAFWGQRYGDWEEITPPRVTASAGNPAQQLDYRRFADAQARANFVAERDILHRLSPGTPVTTNFTTAPSQGDKLDYWAWADEVDLVTNDHYLMTDGRRTQVNLALAADLTRSLAGGAPWLLLEHAPSGVNWQPYNPAKHPGQMARNSLGHVARGSEGAMFFQWRQSVSGAEKYHSAMLPQGGTGTRIWHEVNELGSRVADLADLRGSRTRGDVAMVWSWESWWAQSLEWRPSRDLDARERLDAFYEALYDRHLTVDFLAPHGLAALDPERHPLLVVPQLYLAPASVAADLEAYVRRGGTLLVSFFSGIVDENDTFHPGPHPGALRDVLGLTVEEFSPLLPDERTTVRIGQGDRCVEQPADLWSEIVVPAGCTTEGVFTDGVAAGHPALTRHALGAGTAWYLATRLTGDALATVVDRALNDAGITPPDLPRDVELVVRESESDSHTRAFCFALNHTDTETKIPLPDGTHAVVAPGGVEVWRVPR
ncbi:beta-galactosidase [Streptomyces sp. SID8379]|uniref:beta-galactosidase n=1 Tax=unclassified Streptomyces TaxID=2593676 RepID=UPI000367D4F4|nr:MULTISPECIES: beta-galactosidase [unclassified Streptomyces]MYW64224.1 beta-galactosidase [Streptomyces sp. SID8379]